MPITPPLSVEARVSYDSATDNYRVTVHANGRLITGSLTPYADTAFEASWIEMIAILVKRGIEVRVKPQS